MNEFIEKVNTFIDQHRDDIIATWRDIVNLESFYGDAEGVNRFAARIRKEFEKEGFVCRSIPVGGGHGDVLVGTLGDDRSGAPIMFSGHMDTVFPKGKQGENPFHIEGDKAYGPGVLDMKGGIVIALYTVKALNHIGYNKRPLKILFAGDEECLHYGAKTADVLMEEGRGAACAFNMETGLIDDKICVSRKGKTEIQIFVEGVEAHAGNEFELGRNAIVEMAKKVSDLADLTNLEAGTTVSVGVIKGGTMSGAVPKHCEVAVDMRATKVAEMDKVKKQAEAVCAKTYIDGTSTTFKYTTEMLPFERSDAGMKLYQKVHDIALSSGLGDHDCKDLGGSSDAAYLTIAGVPSVCSCGVRGQWNHTDREYAVVESMFERPKLWANVIAQLF
ncbi:MAG: M20 family metallopeptidase [Clostridia bacterium]|jgi:glutamate carboxypeptidase|nr:M20 family metallopeptidase [Clostridia bacterium]MCI2014292.1 M20 family metallopeptidase [Clostridia bacterium]